jgi:hypothetical protein
MDIIVDLKTVNQCLSRDKKMLGAYVSKHFFLVRLLSDFGANYYTKSNVNSCFILRNRCEVQVN